MGGSLLISMLRRLLIRAAGGFHPFLIGDEEEVSQGETAGFHGLPIIQARPKRWASLIQP